MHLLISDATAPHPDAPAALARLELRHLTALLRMLQPPAWLADRPDTLSTLAEQLHAQALGLQASDGMLPWAALQARNAGLSDLAPPGQGWALVTPCHWRVHADHVYMPSVETLQISPEDDAALLQAMQPYFAEDGITLHPSGPGSWLAHGVALHGLASASLARVGNGVVDTWLPRNTQARAVRRLQNEMQMLLYTHPVNDTRAERGLLAINSFWVSATGDLAPDWQPPASPVSAVRLPQLAAAPAAPNRGGEESKTVSPSHAGASTTSNAAELNDWLEGWKAADATVLAELLQRAQAMQPAERAASVSLTLSGQRGALKFGAAPLGTWGRLRQRFTRPDIASFVKKL